MYPQQEENYHNEIKAFLETAFNDDSVSGGKYQLSVDFWVGNDWQEVYNKKMQIGQFDVGFGSVSGGDSAEAYEYLVRQSGNFRRLYIELGYGYQ